MTLRIAVVGVGSMGRNHARVLSSLKGVQLTALVDIDLNRAKSVSDGFALSAFDDYRKLPGIVDAAIVAVPASAHAEVGCYLLDRGVHCLLEKPMAVTESECMALAASSEKSGAILAVGHIERFNPAVSALFDILRSEGRILSIEARRVSWVKDRNNDVDVLMDLMIHDLDIVLGLVGRKLTTVQANGFSMGGAIADHATALLGFEGGTIATVTASKLTQNKIRQMSVLTEKGLFNLDFQRQEIEVFRQGTERGDMTFGRYNLDVVMERVFVRHTEPLALEVQNFVETIRTGSRPMVGAPEALAALRAAWRIRSQLPGAKS
jgi:predicted dehydrogenase